MFSTRTDLATVSAASSLTLSKCLAALIDSRNSMLLLCKSFCNFIAVAVSPPAANVFIAASRIVLSGSTSAKNVSFAPTTVVAKAKALGPLATYNAHSAGSNKNPDVPPANLPKPLVFNKAFFSCSFLNKSEIKLYSCCEFVANKDSCHAGLTPFSNNPFAELNVASGSNCLPISKKRCACVSLFKYL